jgi:chloride channel 3/4/5
MIPVSEYRAELATFSNESEVMWKGFVASAVAAVGLQWVNPFGTAKLVLFQVSFWSSIVRLIVDIRLQVTFVNDTWRAFELVRLIWSNTELYSLLIQVPWLFLGVTGVRFMQVVDF